jgi:hypothetical protein
LYNLISFGFALELESSCITVVGFKCTTEAFDPVLGTAL